MTRRTGAAGFMVVWAERGGVGGRELLWHWASVPTIPVAAEIKIKLEEHKQHSLIGPLSHWSQVSLLWKVNGGHDRGLTTWLWLHSWETTPITCRRGPGGGSGKGQHFSMGQGFLNASWQAQRQHDYSPPVYTLFWKAFPFWYWQMIYY